MFKERLEMALAMSGMTAAELARKTGISEGMISSYRKGLFAPKSRRIYDLATALNVSPSWLLGFDDPSKEADLDQAIAAVWEALDDEHKILALEYCKYLVASQKSSS